MSSDCHFVLKMVLLGQERSGKSAFLSSLLKERFKQTYAKTTAPEIINTTIVTRLKSFRLQLWDTPGMEECIQNNRSLLPSTSAVLVFYDVTSQESFAKAKKFVELTREELGPKCIVALISTKNDLINKRVSAVEAKDFAHKYNVLFFETCARSQLGIYDSVQLIVDAVYRQIELGVLDPTDPESGIKCGPSQFV